MKVENNFDKPISWLLDCIGPKKFWVLPLVLVQALLAILSLKQVWALREVVDRAVSDSVQAFQKAVVLLVLLIAVQILVRFISRILEETVRSVLENQLKIHLFHTLLKKEYSGVMAIHVGEWLNRLTSDTVAVSSALTQILPGATGLVVRLLGATLLLSMLDWRFCILIVAGGVPLILLTWIFRKILKDLHKQIQESDGRLRVFLQEHISNLLVVRSFAQEETVEQLAEQSMDEHKHCKMKRTIFSSASQSSFSVIMNGVYLLAVLYGGYGILNKTLSYGTFMATLSLVGQIQTPLANLSGYLTRYYAMVASTERLMDADRMKDCSFETVDEWSALGLKDASFTYHVEDEKKIKKEITLHNLNLELCKGDFVAFVGPSGCGKSTALRLLMGIYPLDSGKRYLKHADSVHSVKSILQGLFAYVPQGNQLLSGTIREILSFGDPKKMTEDLKMWEALEIACAADFIKEKENGLDAQLGERGGGLSEGQIQRLAIARAIFSDNPILLLDEATSSLDENTERLLLLNLRQMTEKTVVLVTHRPAALSIVDKIIDFSELGVTLDQ